MNSKVIFYMFLIVFAVLLTTQVFSFAMSPGYYKLEYDELTGLQEEVSFILKSRSDQDIMIEVELEDNLKEYIEVSKEDILLKPGEAAEIPIKLDFPSGLDVVGNQNIRVLFTKKIRDGSGFMAVTTAYRARIIIVFAYPGEYIFITKLEPESVNEGEEATINWGVRARGTKTTGFVSEITIFDTDNEEVFYKKYPKTFLERNEEHEKTTLVSSQEFTPGNYKVLLESSSADNYHNMTANLRIGEEDLELKSFNPKNFSLGEIVEFSFTIENLWNGEFNNVYGVLDFGNVSTTTRSGEVGSFEELTIDKQYIDLRTFNEGTHRGTLTIFFDGKNKVFDVEIEGLKTEEEKSSNTIIIIMLVLVLLIVLFLLIFLFKKVNKKHDE